MVTHLSVVRTSPQALWNLVLKEEGQGKAGRAEGFKGRRRLWSWVKHPFASETYLSLCTIYRRGKVGCWG
jgi:hypothetical protein